jgi:hypothetical protein
LDMARPNYVCTTCSEHFTRKYSAKRHNITVHHNNGGGEIVPLVEYLVGMKSGRYQASHPFWYGRNGKRTHKFGRPTIADSTGDAPGLQRGQQGQHQFHQQSLEQQERYHGQHQEQSLSPSIPPSPAAIQDQPPDVLPYPTDPTFQSESVNTTEDEEKTTTTLSHETILKIEELKILIYRYSQYHHNPGAVINCIIYYCNNGDNTFLDEKLEQLRMLDSALGYHRM